MAENRLILKTLVVLSFVFAGSTFAAASCAADAYRKSCSSCPFDDRGKMDQPCYQGYQSGGTACVSASYPMAAGLYAQGKCPDIDACASELSSCKAQYSSGNDTADCAEGSVSVCFSAADQCVAKAAAKCEGIKPPCGLPIGLIALAIGGAFLAGFVRRE
ncbi:Uncharacterised protein [uncultured archaeon]|nr:Uncharacterised protein [uncultured archaeon]